MVKSVMVTLLLGHIGMQDGCCLPKHSNSIHFPRGRSHHQYLPGRVWTGFNFFRQILAGVQRGPPPGEAAPDTSTGCLTGMFSFQLSSAGTSTTTTTVRRLSSMKRTVWPPRRRCRTSRRGRGESETPTIDDGLHPNQLGCWINALCVVVVVPRLSSCLPFGTNRSELKEKVTISTIKRLNYRRPRFSSLCLLLIYYLLAKLFGGVLFV